MGSVRADLMSGSVGEGAAAPGAVVNTNGVVFWPVAVLVLLADLTTKAFAEAALGPAGFPHRIIGDAVRLNLVYNPGAAFGLSLGPYSRVIFLALTAVILRVLWGLYRSTRDRDNRRVVALALLAAGAVAARYARRSDSLRDAVGAAGAPARVRPADDRAGAEPRDRVSTAARRGADLVP